MAKVHLCGVGGVVALEAKCTTASDSAPSWAEHDFIALVLQLQARGKAVSCECNSGFDLFLFAKTRFLLYSFIAEGSDGFKSYCWLDMRRSCSQPDLQL